MRPCVYLHGEVLKCFVLKYFGDSCCVCSKPARDQHPDHDVAEGEMLIKEVYEAVRNGPNWNSTLLLITYDEHGGFYVSATTPTCSLPTLHVFSVILRTVLYCREDQTAVTKHDHGVCKGPFCNAWLTQQWT